MANTEPNTGYRLVRLMGMSCMCDSDTLLPRPRSLREPARVACNTFLGLVHAAPPRTRSGGERAACNAFLGLWRTLQYRVGAHTNPAFSPFTNPYKEFQDTALTQRVLGKERVAPTALAPERLRTGEQRAPESKKRVAAISNRKINPD